MAAAVESEQVLSREYVVHAGKRVFPSEERDTRCVISNVEESCGIKIQGLGARQLAAVDDKSPKTIEHARQGVRRHVWRETPRVRVSGLMSRAIWNAMQVVLVISFLLTAWLLVQTVQLDSTTIASPQTLQSIWNCSNQPRDLKNGGLQREYGDPEMNSTEQAPLTDVVIVAGGEQAFVEAEVLLKSILIFSTGPLRINMVVDDVSRRLARKFFSSIGSADYNIAYRFSEPEQSWYLDKATSVRYNFTHRAGKWVVAKAFAHELFPDLDHVVVLDTDILFVKPIQVLAREAERIASSEAIFAAPLDGRGSSNHFLCSCMYVASYAKIRAIPFTKRVLAAAERLFIQPGTTDPVYEWADQSMLIALRTDYPEYFLDLPPAWSQSVCQGITMGEVGLLHFNCLYSDPYWNKMQPQFRPYVDFVKQYRMRWLAVGMSRRIAPHEEPETKSAPS